MNKDSSLQTWALYQKSALQLFATHHDISFKKDKRRGFVSIHIMALLHKKKRQIKICRFLFCVHLVTLNTPLTRIKTYLQAKNNGEHNTNRQKQQAEQCTPRKAFL